MIFLNKKNKKLFFFLIIIFTAGLSIIPFALALDPPETIEWDFANIDSSWLSVRTGDFQDKNTADGSGKLHIGSGGVRLESFTNEGLVGNTNGTVAYKASAIFKVGINLATLVGPTDIYSTVNLGAMKSGHYVKVNKYTVMAPTGYVNLQIINAYIWYRSISYGGTFYPHDYDGVLPINLTINKDWSDPDILNINGYEFRNPTITAEIKRAVITDTRIDNIADYDDVFRGQDIQDGSVTAFNPTATAPALGTGTYSDRVTTLINSWSLGWSYGSRTSGLTWTAGGSGQSMAVAQATGTTYDNYRSGENFQFDLPFRLKPEITYDTQVIDRKYGIIDWDYEDVWLLSPANAWLIAGPYIYADSRLAAIHVDNVYLHHEIRVEVNFIATCQLDPELGGDELGDPYVETGDFVWDENTYGMTDLEIGFSAPGTDFAESMFGGIWSLVILIIVGTIIIFIVIKVLPKLLIKAIKKK